jgi:hypothetical protein
MSPDLLNAQLRSSLRLGKGDVITWHSPLSRDEYAEYRDQAFLDLLQIDLKSRPLSDFWPPRGPQWDALGKSRSGNIFLVEAKAHIEEVLSPGARASAESKQLIDKSLYELQNYLRAAPTVDWSRVFYQIMNRIAHLYLVRVLNQLPAYLVFVYSVGDEEMGGPLTVGEWQSALYVIKGLLGLGTRHRLSKYMADVFIDVSQLRGRIA